MAFLVPLIKERLGEVFQALIQERIHEHILEPSFSRTAVIGSGNRVNLAVTPRRSCMKEAAMTRAREEQDEFFQTGPQDETMKVRQAEMYLRRHPEQLEELSWNEGLFVVSSLQL